MTRIARAHENLLHLNIDLILQICSHLLQSDFLDFCNFFQVWHVSKSDAEIFNLLHNLDWSSMHLYDFNWNNDRCNRFKLFKVKCNNLGVLHFMSYEACKNVFSDNERAHNMYTLEMLAHHDHFSYFALNFFRSWLEQDTFFSSSKKLHLKFIHNPVFNQQMERFATSLKGILQRTLSGWHPPLQNRPSFPICSLYKYARNEHFSPYSWPPFFLRVKNSHCHYCFLHMLFYIIFP